MLPSVPACASSGASAPHSGDCAVRAPMPLAPTASTTASTSVITAVLPVVTDRVSSERMLWPSADTLSLVARVPPSTSS